MLNQLVESKNHSAENARKNSFLVTVLGIFIAVLLSGWTYSLFAKNFGMGTGNLELSSIVAPVVAAEEPPKPEIQPEPEQRQSASSNEKPTVIEKNPTMEDSLNNPPRIEDSRPLNSKPLKSYEMEQYSEGPENRYSRSDRTDSTDGGDGIKITPTTKTDDEEKMPELVKKAKPEPAPSPKVTKISGGVLNGKATYLAKPAYPAAAKAMGITGSVNVQVMIDEKGNVVSAAVVSGHPLLRAGAENAARQSRFTPTFLSEQPVKVTGVIVYQFKP
jgi:TonB family protein